MRKGNASKWFTAWDYDCRKIFKHRAKACREAKKIAHRMERRAVDRELLVESSKVWLDNLQIV